jgi:methylated-DNA-[protein]-cysteine S-methyltransferase
MEARKRIYYAETDSPIGPITVASTSQGICWIDFGNGKKTLLNLERWAKLWLKTDLIEWDDRFHQPIFAQLHEYFAGERKQFAVPLDLQGTNFQKMVWESLLSIPYGETRSYKEVALHIRAPKAVRAIGGANNKNPIPIIIPCHRVVGSNGALVGYGGGLEIKEFLLELEKNHSHIGYIESL